MKLGRSARMSTSTINVPDADGKPALAWAADCGNDTLCTLLLYGADFSGDPSTNRSPLHYAGRSRTPKCLSILLDRGALTDVRTSSDSSPIHIASFYQNEPAYLSLLLQHDADVENRQSWWGNPLGSALVTNHTRAAQ